MLFFLLCNFISIYHIFNYIKCFLKRGTGTNLGHYFTDADINILTRYLPQKGKKTWDIALIFNLYKNIESRDHISTGTFLIFEI